MILVSIKTPADVRGPDRLPLRTSSCNAGAGTSISTVSDVLRKRGVAGGVVNGLIGLLRFVSRIVFINMVWVAGERVNDVNAFVQDHRPP